MKKLRKNLLMGILITAAAVTGYFVQENDYERYVLEIESETAGVQSAALTEEESYEKGAGGKAEELSQEDNFVGDEKEAVSDRINLNTATAAELDSLPGIGAVKAERIIEYREKTGGFEVVEDIMRVDGIGRKTFEELKDYITVE